MSIFARSLLVFGALAVGATVNVARADNWPETVLWNFAPPGVTGEEFGDLPQMGVVIDSSGIYGSASDGGTKGGGAVYQRVGNDMHVLYSFTDGDETSCGYTPNARLLVWRSTAPKVVFGTTYQGGSGKGGVLFKLTEQSNPDKEWICTPIHSFSKAGDTGYGPSGGLLKVGNDTLYGTTQFNAKKSVGGVMQPSGGVIFSLVKSGGGWTYTPLHKFPVSQPTNGLVPTGPLVADQAGVLYGATFFGGVHDGGVVYKFDPAGNVYTPIYKFNGDSTLAGAKKGYQPTQGPLVVDTSGVVYGATVSGGRTADGEFVNAGVVYKLTPGAPLYSYQLLHSFDNVNFPELGFAPIGGIVLGQDGFLYGNNQFGGASGGGSVFRLAGANKTRFELLYDFPDSTLGFRPSGPLTVGGAGTITGTTLVGGTNSAGTIFRLTKP